MKVNMLRLYSLILKSALEVIQHFPYYIIDQTNVNTMRYIDLKVTYQSPNIARARIL
jgi:hypothetical protein